MVESGCVRDWESEWVELNSSLKAWQHANYLNLRKGKMQERSKREARSRILKVWIDRQWQSAPESVADDRELAVEGWAGRIDKSRGQWARGWMFWEIWNRATQKKNTRLYSNWENLIQPLVGRFDRVSQINRFCQVFPIRRREQFLRLSSLLSILVLSPTCLTDCSGLVLSTIYKGIRKCYLEPLSWALSNQLV